MKKVLKRVVAFILTLAMCVCTTGAAASAEASVTTGVVQSSWDGMTTENKYVGENFSVTFSLSGYWNGGYNANIKVENTGSSVIENWYLSFALNNKLTTIWNAEVVSNENGQYVVKNANWNEDIPVGGCAEFGISVNENFTGFPSTYKLLGENTQVQEDACSVEYILDSDWGSGFTARVLLTNNTEETLEDWTLEFDFDREITSIWNGVIENHEGNHYVIKNAGHNANIVSGSAISFGFNGEGGTAENVPCEYEVYSYKMNSIEYVELSDGKIDKAYLERAIYTNLLIRNMSIDDVKLSDDYDGDGLSLAEEYEYDTNPFSVDTDEDGLDDYSETNIYGTNPIKSDTDNDGMSDGTEVSCGLNPLLRDTDGNGIEDGQEVVTQEVRLDSVKKYNLQDVGTLPSMTMTGKGDYSQEIYAISLENDARFTEIDSLVGTPFDIVHEDDLTFEKSCVTFTISDEILAKTPIEELAIASYIEDTNSIEILETTYDVVNQTISAEPNHYSPIFVFNLLKFLQGLDLDNEDSIIESGKADVVFVIDTTGSMWDEIQNVRNNIESFVSRLEENKVDIRLGLVEYRDIYEDGVGSTKSYDWYTSVDSFKNELSSLGVDGGGDIPESVVDALFCARNMKYRSGVRKYIILLTDADYKNGTSVDAGATLEDEIQKLCTEEIVVSVVTTPYYASVYNQLVSQTEGVSANINQNFTTALEPLIVKMGDSINKGCWVRLSNGTIVELDADPTLGDDTVDTDRDGIPDVIELIECVEVSREDPISGNIVKYKGWTFESNPVKPDTDGDGLLDVDDLDNNKYDAVILVENEKYIKFNSGRTWHKINCTAYEYLDNTVFSNGGNGPDGVTIDNLSEIKQKVNDNEKQDFSIDELVYIEAYNIYGAQLYMHEKSSAVREEVFRIVIDREPEYYKHSGILSNSTWSKVPKGTEGGFFKGVVLSEADINYSWKVYSEYDVYHTLSVLIAVGALVIAEVLVVKATPVVLAKLQLLIYDVRTYGVIQGFKMYKYLGFQNLPDGVITWVRMDMADGDSCLDEFVDASIPIYERGKTGEQALAAAHPGESQKYFQTFVNGVKGGRYVDQFSNGVAYEAKVGYTCLSQRIKTQILKDVYLMKNGDVSSVVWEFYRSDITGRVGASKELLQFLTEHGIDFVIHQ